MPRFFAACTLGLEEVLVDELHGVEAAKIRARRGGAEFEGDLATGYRACLWLRSATRVQEELVRGAVRDREDLYALTDSVDWSIFITPRNTLAVDGAVRDSFANDTRYPSLVVKDAICDQFVRFDGERPSVDRDQPDLPIKLVLQRDRAILYRDLGGAPLHKRGYREVQHKSPLNEALAAGLVLLSDWDGESPLADPMCGSGTFLIEAAFLAMDRAPGLGRAFAFERWKDTDQGAWQQVYDEAEERAARRQDLCPKIAGNDHHPGALAIATRAVQQAQLSDRIQLAQTDARAWQPPFEPGWILTNPPYGARLQADDDSLYESWRSLGNFLHQRADATAHVLCGDPALTRHLGLRAARKHPVHNGPIECRWLRYEVGGEDG